MSNILQKLTRRKWVLAGLVLLLAGAAFKFFHDQRPPFEDYRLNGKCFRIPAGYVVAYIASNELGGEDYLGMISKWPDLSPNSYQFYHPDPTSHGPFEDRGVITISIFSNSPGNVSGQALLDRNVEIGGIKNLNNPVKDKLGFNEYYGIINTLYEKEINNIKKVVSCSPILNGHLKSTCEYKFPLFVQDEDKYLYKDMIKVETGPQHLNDMFEIGEAVRAKILSWMRC